MKAYMKKELKFKKEDSNRWISDTVIGMYVISRSFMGSDRFSVSLECYHGYTSGLTRPFQFVSRKEAERIANDHWQSYKMKGMIETNI